jgi:uncharacterized protein
MRKPLSSFEWEKACLIVLITLLFQGFSTAQPTAQESAIKPSFNCERAKTKVEYLICGDQSLSKLDAEMSELYQNIQSETAGVDGATGRVIDPIGAEQKAWRTRVRDRCKTVACLNEMYRKRIQDMKRKWDAAL